MKSQNFFAQLLVRLCTDNPKFFKWIQVASIALTGLSAVLNALPPTYTPSWLEWSKQTVVWAIGLSAIVLMQLPNKDPK